MAGGLSVWDLVFVVTSFVQLVLPLTRRYTR